MAFIVNGTAVKKLIANGVTCKKHLANGVQVFNSELIVFPDADRSWGEYESKDGAGGRRASINGASLPTGTKIVAESGWYNSYNDYAYAYTTVDLTGFDTVEYHFWSGAGTHGNGGRYNQAGVEIVSGGTVVASSMKTVTANGDYTGTVDVSALTGEHQLRFRLNYSFGNGGYDLKNLKLT